jgi:hypothetical protein
MTAVDPLRPHVQAILVADRVYVDEQTKKKIIVGIFRTLQKNSIKPTLSDNNTRQIEIPSHGMDSGSPWAFISITNIRDADTFALHYIDLLDDRIYLEVKFSVSKPASPTQVVDIVIPLPRLPIPERKTGVCELALIWRKEPIGRFKVHFVNNDIEDE